MLGMGDHALAKVEFGLEKRDMKAPASLLAITVCATILKANFRRHNGCGDDLRVWVVHRGSARLALVLKHLCIANSRLLLKGQHSTLDSLENEADLAGGHSVKGEDMSRCFDYHFVVTMPRDRGEVRVHVRYLVITRLNSWKLVLHDA
jgi:hypothetical protein